MSYPTIFLKPNVVLHVGQTVTFADIFAINPGDEPVVGGAIRITQIPDVPNAAYTIGGGSPIPGADGKTQWEAVFVGSIPGYDGSPYPVSDFWSMTITPHSTNFVFPFYYGWDLPDREGFVYDSVTAAYIGLRAVDSAIVSIPGGGLVDEGSGNVEFTVTLDRALPYEVVVGYTTREGTATAGEDYATSTNQILTFAAGTTSQSISIPIIDDGAGEPQESFSVRLTGAVAGGTGVAPTIGSGTAFAFIVDNDRNEPPVAEGTSLDAEFVGIGIISGVEGSLAALSSDPDGDTLTFAILKSPTHGGVALQDDGTFRYLAADYGDPDPSSPDDYFIFSVSDGEASATARVDIRLPTCGEARDHALAPTKQQLAAAEAALAPLLARVEGNELTIDLVEEGLETIAIAEGWLFNKATLELAAGLAGVASHDVV
jgi:hypothetical protein